MVSINTSTTLDIRRALSKNIDDATTAANALATGERLQKAYQDPTGLAIGSNMRQERNILSVVTTGIEQSKAMLYIAEEGVKSAELVLGEMNTILARAKLGYMNDELVEKTLSKAYMQMKAELQRISESVSFNGQRLLDGNSGIKVNGTRSTVTSSIKGATATATTTLSAAPTGIAGLTAQGTNSDGTNNINGLDLAGSTVAVNGGTYAIDSTGKVTLTGATVTLSGVKCTVNDANLGGDSTSKADLTLENVTLELNGGTLTGNTLSGSGITISANNAKATFSNFRENTSNGIDSINVTSTASLSLTLPDAATMSVTGVESDTVVIGGVESTSNFKFVTGTDLAHDLIQVAMPNISLDDKNGVLGMLSTLNYETSSGFVSKLSDLKTIADADQDIPVVQKLLDKIIEYRNSLGAFELRFINLENQLKTSVVQTDMAQAAIMHTDLPAATEDAARAKVNINLAISQINAALEMLQNLQKIVTG